jgi:hypothetical protein
VKLIRLDEGDEIAAITKLEDQHVADNGNGNSNGTEAPIEGPTETGDENATSEGEISSGSSPE